MDHEAIVRNRKSNLHKFARSRRGKNVISPVPRPTLRLKATVRQNIKSTLNATIKKTSTRTPIRSHRGRLYSQSGMDEYTWNDFESPAGPDHHWQMDQSDPRDVGKASVWAGYPPWSTFAILDWEKDNETSAHVDHEAPPQHQDAPYSATEWKNIFDAWVRFPDDPEIQDDGLRSPPDGDRAIVHRALDADGIECSGGSSPAFAMDYFHFPQPHQMEPRGDDPCPWAVARIDRRIREDQGAPGSHLDALCCDPAAMSVSELSETSDLNVISARPSRSVSTTPAANHTTRVTAAPQDDLGAPYQPLGFRCPQCDRVFHSRGGRTQHMRRACRRHVEM